MEPEDKDLELRDDSDDGGDNVDVRDEKPAKMSVRESIQAAIKETAEDEPDKEDKKEEKEPKEPKEPRKLQRTKSDEQTLQKSDEKKEKEQTRLDSDTSKLSKDSKQVSKSAEGQPSEKLKPPPGFTKEAKAEWETWSPGLQKSIIKREQEYAQGISQYSSKAKAYDELDKVIAPYREAIQQFGTTEAETVGNLFQWMMALSNQNANNRANAFKVLAQSFNVDISQLVPSNFTRRSVEDDDETDTNTRQQQQGDPNQPPSWFVQYAQESSNEIKNLKQFLSTQGETAARTFVGNWAQDKPYFQHVKEIMHKLIDSGTVPLKQDGSVDLDGAYDAACKLHSGVAENIALEKEKEAATAAQAKQAQEAKARAEKVRKARAAGVSLTSNAPADTVSSGKPNGVGGKTQSVRESIMAAMREARE
jgi:hypothetical protein